MKLQHSALTDVGQVREVNQDSFGIGEPFPDGSQLYVVCDGMGGHVGGEIASQTAVATVLKVFNIVNDDVPQAMRESFDLANRAVMTEGGNGNMGTTGVAFMAYRNLGFIANIGDSRAYIVRNGILRQITIDHSLVEEQVRAGLLTREQANVSNVKNIVTRGIGFQLGVQTDVFYEPLQVDDIILLCSDGLHGYTEESEVLKLITTPPFETAAQRLVQLANAAGGLDNITALAVKIIELDEDSLDDALLATLLKQTITSDTAALPLASATAATGPLGPTGTTPMPVAAPASATAPPRERSLTTWGCLGALVVLVAVIGLLYAFNLPPVNLLLPRSTNTPAATAAATLIPTVTVGATTPITGTSEPLLTPAGTATLPAVTPATAVTPTP